MTVHGEHASLLITLAIVPASLRWLGGALAVVASVLLIVARMQLGKCFSVRARPKDLVTRGLYSRIRHPMFIFVSLSILGLAVELQVPYLLPFLVVSIPLQFRRSRQEDQPLAEKFGRVYEEYKKRTWFWACSRSCRRFALTSFGPGTCLRNGGEPSSEPHFSRT